MLEQLTPSKPEKSGLKTLDSFANHSESESETTESETSNISKIENAFINLEAQIEPKVKKLEKHISPTSLTRNWYPRPTPPDIQFEERNLQTQFSVSSDKLYEWNIDGLSEQEIFNKLQHMSMVANSYITNHSFRQSEIVPLLVTGFTGTLRYWWDKHLTPESKNLIIHAVKLNEDGLPIFDEHVGHGIEDGVNTLFYTIIEHFIGTPSNTTARIHDQLSNLRCPKLSDFRWYKDVFISRVMLRDDSNQPFWKEKFVNGLPNLFAHKIRTTLSNEQGHIDWDSLTYGNIISTINQVGMKMCIDFKIGKQIQSDRKSAKYELGNFCEQYGLASIPPSKKNKPNYFRKNRHYSRRKQFSQHNNDDREFYKKRKSSPKKNWSKAPKDEEKEKLIKVLELRDSETSSVETLVASSESESDQFSDSQISSPDIQIGCNDKCCNRLKSISVLTKQEEQEELLIELISKVENPDLKSEYLKKLRKVISQESSSQPTPQPSENYAIEQDLIHIMEKESSESKSQSGSPHNSDDEPPEDQQVVNLIRQVDYDGVISTYLGEKVKFEFLSKPELHNLRALQKQSVSKKQHVVYLPYIKTFSEKNIPTKARPIQMSQEIMEFCKKEIHELLEKKIIRKSKSPWSCPAFYVQKNAELERGVPRLVINYKPLNSVLEWIRYKTAFVTPFGHYEWNVMPFGLKNAPSEFQNIMNEIFNPYSHFSIVYIDDVLIFSESIEQHLKHLHKFLQIVKQNGLVVSAKKIKLFQTNIRFLGFNICQSQISPIDRVIQFADKFPDQILDKSQLQRFLGSLNYVSNFYQNLRKQCKPLFDRLQSNPPPWSNIHTEIVKQIKAHVKTLPCLGIPSVDSFKIVETDASDTGYGGILKQRACPNSPEQIVRCTMAPKKDKQKESTSQSKSSQSPSQSLKILPASMSQNKPEIPKQVVPYPGHPPISVATPISIANRFSTLGSTAGQIRPSYQSTLISSYDPFFGDSPAGPSVAFKKSSPYMLKSTSHLFVLEPVYDVHSDPVEIAKHYFPPGFHYMPPSSYKSLKYYRDILLETQSVEIKPIRDKDHPEIILYHSLYIHKIPIPRPVSPTGSTRSSLSVEGKSKSELQEIARQLIIQASQRDDDEDNDSPSSSSCQPMQSPAKKKSWFEDS
ncbi:unnamed protein product [Prunus armeniaca]